MLKVNILPDTAIRPERDNPARGETAERIMDAAENLFGEVGFLATTVRDIAGAANTSPGSINYYFGSKDGLIRAVIQRVSEPITVVRMARMRSLENQYGDAPIPLVEILRSFLDPLFEDGGAGRHKSISRLLAQVTVTADPKIGSYWTEYLGETGRTYVGALQKTLGHLTRAEVFLRYQLFLLSTYDNRAFSSWYWAWAKEEFDLNINEITLEQRIALFDEMFSAKDHVPPVA